MSFKKNTFVVSINLIVIIGLIIISEVISSFVYHKYYQKNDPINKISWTNYYQFYFNSPLIGPREANVQDIKDSQTFQGDFNSTYTLDSKGLRAYPRYHNKKDISFLLFGCSFTFGSGVNDNETFPYYLQKKVLNSDSYNLGIPGYGPIEALESIKNIQNLTGLNPQDLKNKKIIGIFLFFDEHINRAYLNFAHVYWSDLRQLKEAKLNKENQTIEIDFLYKSNFLKYFTYSIIQTSSFSRIIYLRSLSKKKSTTFQEPIYSAKELKLTSSILKEIQKEFYRIFPKGHFFTVSLDTKRYIAKSFIKNGLHLLENNDFKARYHLPDGHMAPQSNEELAKSIIQKLKQKNLIN